MYLQLKHIIFFGTNIIIDGTYLQTFTLLFIFYKLKKIPNNFLSITILG